MSKKVVVSREQAIRNEANAVPEGKAVVDLVDWRGDSEETYSDWTIQVVSCEDGKKTYDQYHVHRNKLGIVGPRSSEYFTTAFKARFAEQNNKTTKLELPPLAASCFPKLLDFAYYLDEDLAVDAMSATPLLFLGQYLQMEQVKLIAKTFIERDIDASTENLATYWEHSQFFPEVHDILGNFMFDELTKFLRFDALVVRTPLGVWERVAVRMKENKDTSASKETRSKDLSRLVLTYLSGSPGQTSAQSSSLASADNVQNILTEECMPVVHPEVALQLMLTESIQLWLSAAEEFKKTLAKSVLDRCCDTLAQSEHFQHLILLSDENDPTYKSFTNLPGPFVAKAFNTVRSQKEDPRSVRQQAELEVQLKSCSDQELVEKTVNMERTMIEELDTAFEDVKVASPDATLEEVLASPQYQAVEERRSMQRKAFNNVRNARRLEEMKGTGTKQPRATTTALVPLQGDTIESEVKMEDRYPLGTKVFHRDSRDGFAGREYPAVVVRPKGKMSDNMRRISYKGYTPDYDIDVPVTELLEWTKERADFYKNETIPLLKANDAAVKECQQKLMGDKAEHDSVKNYVEKEYYFYRDPDKIEYKVQLLQICPRAKGKGKIQYMDYKKRHPRVELSLLKPATEEREKLYAARKASFDQEKELKKLQREAKKERQQQVNAKLQKSSSSSKAEKTNSSEAEKPRSKAAPAPAKKETAKVAKKETSMAAKKSAKSAKSTGLGSSNATTAKSKAKACSKSSQTAKGSSSTPKRGVSAGTKTSNKKVTTTTKTNVKKRKRHDSLTDSPSAQRRKTAAAATTTSTQVL